MPHKILFVCLGNICRSPMAEYIMKDMVKRAGREAAFHIESAATSREELGNPIYPPAKRILACNGVTCEGHIARQVTPDDYTRFDHIVCMDCSNLRNLIRIFGGDPENKISLLMDHTDRVRGTEVADPWYTGNFEATWRDCVEGCKALLNELED